LSTKRKEERLTRR